MSSRRRTETGEDMSLVLGVDAGATKTFALVADENGHILGFGQAGSGNHQVVGLEPALAEIRRSSEEALAQAGSSPPVAFGFFGLAGADLPVDFALLTPAVATHNRTTLTGGDGSAAAIEARVAEIRTLMEQTEDKHTQDKLQQRLAALKDGVATIRVGGVTRAQRDERERLFKKALAAVRGAVEEGIQPGGAVAFLNVIPALDAVEPECMEEAAAVRCLQRAFEVPLRQLAANAGEDGGAVLEEVCRRQDETRNPFIGYDVLRREFGDLREWGILDSTRTARTVVQNAISAASILLTVEATVGVVPGQWKAIRYQLDEEAEKRDLWRKKQRYKMKRRRRLGRQKPPKRVW